MVSFGYRVSKMTAFSPCRWPKDFWPFVSMLLSNIETRSRQREFRVICISDMPKRSEKRDFTQCKELVSPSKKRLENRATSREEGEDVPGPSSGEDTVSNIL